MIDLRLRHAGTLTRATQLLACGRGRRAPPHKGRPAWRPLVSAASASRIGDAGAETWPLPHYHEPETPSKEPRVSRPIHLVSFRAALAAALFSFAAAGCATPGAPQAGAGAAEGRAGPGGVSERLLDLQQRLIADEVTGSNVALVVRDGEVVHHRVVNSGKEGDRDVDADTLFPIWSMSKPITIVAMMTLHEKGLFEWDDPVSEYLPCFANLTVRDGEALRPATEALRIEHLMAHRSGFSYDSFTSPPPYGSAHPNQTRYRDLQQYVEAAAKTPLQFEPGSAYLYGTNQAILGGLVEVLSGLPFSGYLEQALFEPLGMNETSFVLDAERRERFQPLFINAGNLKGFTFALDELTYSPESRAHFGGEGLVSTLGDYARFCEMLVGGGVFRGRRILSRESIDTMTGAATEDFDLQALPGFHMGFSLFVLADHAREATRAPAGIYGWAGYHNTHFWIDPASNLYALFMSRSRDFNWSIPEGLRLAVYGADE